ncbi:MAG: zinc ribbon domain-containing protein [Deltaproteobacteria bacterium]|nr:zinc ribbon domain-containing protein [Deltaproteobacteria bacterium]PWB67136.1 MAG: FmdB family transcriptional regulator [Deltaproteobacteria bacterium]
MPTYEYKCKKCGEFEAVQKMSDPPLSKCPTCKGKVERQIGGTGGFVLKGSNWVSKMSSSGEDLKKKADRFMKQTVGEVAEDIAKHSRPH